MSDEVEMPCDAVANIYIAFMRFIIDRVPTAQSRDDGAVAWVLSGIPHPIANIVVQTHWDNALSPEAIREQISATLAPFAARQVPMSWMVWPSSQPADLAQHLADYGLRHAGDEPAMIRDLGTPPPQVPAVPGLRIERVRDAAAFERWLDTSVAVFASSEEERAAMREFALMGYDHPMCQFLGLMDGQPVAIATLLLAGDVAGIFNVATLPQSRGKGIGAAITTLALEDARRARCRVAGLLSSPMGYETYRRLGFEQRCTVGMYVWTPA
jgi:GNAT superfamily N-acetyltransferase